MKNKLISILERYGNSIGDKLKSYILQYADSHSRVEIYLSYECNKPHHAHEELVVSSSGASSSLVLST